MPTPPHSFQYAKGEFDLSSKNYPEMHVERGVCRGVGVRHEGSMVLACDILPIDESVQALCHAGFAKAPNVLQDLVYSQGKSTSFCIDVRVRAFMMRVRGMSSGRGVTSRAKTGGPSASTASRSSTTRHRRWARCCRAPTTNEVLRTLDPANTLFATLLTCILDE